MKNSHYSHHSHCLHSPCLSSIKRPVYVFAVLSLLSLLTACGGSNSKITPTTTPTPIPATTPIANPTTTPAPTPSVQNIAVTVGNEQLSLAWSLFADISSYNLYYATESLNTLVPVNYQTVASAVRLEDITSPHVITGLDGNQTYFLTVTVVTRAGVESIIGNEVTGTPSPPIKLLNDTGIIRCGDTSSSDENCPIVAFPNQDAENGRDAQLVASLNKVGEGKAGFDFSRLDSDGVVLAVAPTTPTNWSCVKDNHTGLTWEVKTDNDTPNLQDKDHDYTWFNTDSSNNGEDVGTPDGGTCVGSDCDTTTYAAAVNAQLVGLCGATDWRVPTREELRSITDYSFSFPPAVDTDYFPNTVTTGDYWSSSPSVNSGGAWLLGFRGGESRTDGKDQNHHVRLVRGER